VADGRISGRPPGRVGTSSSPPRQRETERQREVRERDRQTLTPVAGGRISFPPPGRVDTSSSPPPRGACSTKPGPAPGSDNCPSTCRRASASIGGKSVKLCAHMRGSISCKRPGGRGGRGGIPLVYVCMYECCIHLCGEEGEVPGVGQKVRNPVIALPLVGVHLPATSEKSVDLSAHMRASMYECCIHYS
jgi:hypothetical protein